MRACTCSNFAARVRGRARWLPNCWRGEIGRLAGLPVPEIVFVELPVDLARTEPDSEIQNLIRASGGVNLALDYLPGSVTFDPLVYQPDPYLASCIVWFDAFVCNVDRTVRNVNMLLWHRRLWLIDHGASLYFHHAWDRQDQHARSPFPLIKDHVLLEFASVLPQANADLLARLDEDALQSLVACVPDDWLPEDAGFDDRAQQRSAYMNYFRIRLQSSHLFVEEALRARAAYV